MTPPSASWPKCACLRACTSVCACVGACTSVRACGCVCVRFLALVIYSSKELHLLSFHCVWTNEWRGTNLSWLSVLLRCRGQQQNIFPNEFLSKTWWSKSCIFRPNKSNWSLSLSLIPLSLSLSHSLSLSSCFLSFLKSVSLRAQCCRALFFFPICSADESGSRCVWGSNQGR